MNILFDGFKPSKALKWLTTFIARKFTSKINKQTNIGKDKSILIKAMNISFWEIPKILK